jgi:hypothetical protein
MILNIPSEISNGDIYITRTFIAVFSIHWSHYLSELIKMYQWRGYVRKPYQHMEIIYLEIPPPPFVAFRIKCCSVLLQEDKA